MARTDEYYSKILDAIEVVHAENVIIIQGLIKLFGNGEDSQKIEKACKETEKSWNDTFSNIRKW